jgi:ubiquinone/menaquinone biosynthesis C-methylase UbiE
VAVERVGNPEVEPAGDVEYIEDMTEFGWVREMTGDTGGAFRATYAELYDRHLVPMLFAPYARMLADRATAFGPRSILETAAGTGIVTQELARTFSAGVSITATDLNQPMIDRAKRRPGMAEVTWLQADAMDLPFPDRSFDLVACQFGAMFFADKQGSFREAWRVLRGGGAHLFLVWDSWKDMPDSPLAIAADVVAEMLGYDPSSLVSPPYHDEDTIRADLRAAGFRRVAIERIAQPAEAMSAREAAVATVHGSLIRTAIEKTDAALLDGAADAVERALQMRFGQGRIVGTTKALAVVAEKPLV